MNLVLVGCGSVGRKYKAQIEKLIPNIEAFYIVEINDKVLYELREQKYKCFKNIDDLKDKKIKVDYAIVANWGPEHIKTANQLIDLGCKRIIIEKPLSDRKEGIETFKKRCLRENIFVTVHYRYSYTDIVEKIRGAENELSLGNPVGIRIIGGSVCLSTNGSHFLALGCELLNSSPQSVMAELELDYINPRAKHLLNIGGFSVYKMDNGTYINVSFLNESSENTRFEIIYRNSIIEFKSDGKLRIFSRNMLDVEKYDDKITRYGTLYFKKEIQFENPPTVEIVLNNLLYGKEPIFSIEKAEEATLMVIGAIQSHIEGKRIDYSNIKDNGLLIS